MPLQIVTPFAIPFALNHYPDSAPLNQELRTLFLAREAQGERYANRTATMRIHQGLFESAFDLFKWPEECVRELRDFCWNSLYQLISDVSSHDVETIKRLTGHADAWFHVTRRGGYFPLHNHPMASWSGVYCVDAGGDDGGHRDSGVLSFPNPNGMGSMFVDPANEKLKMPYALTTRLFRLVPGQLVLFPSWLMHQVTPFRGEGERITVAFNAWFVGGSS